MLNLYNLYNRKYITHKTPSVPVIEKELEF